MAASSVSQQGGICMTKSNILTALICLFMVSACQQHRYDEFGKRLGIIKRSPEVAMIEGSSYYEFPEYTPGVQYRPESTFCYKAQTDILCYEEPRKGWENRMVGYQEPRRPRQGWPSYKTGGYYYRQNTPPMDNASMSYNANNAADSSYNMATVPSVTTGGEIDSRNLPPLPSVTISGDSTTPFTTN